VEVLATGGNSLLGRHLVSAMRDRGDTVRVLWSRTHDTWPEQQGVTACRGDIGQPETLQPAMRGMQAVLRLDELVGTWRPMKEYYAVNVTGIENVCPAALGAVRQGVRLTSAWYMRTRRERILPASRIRSSSRFQPDTPHCQVNQAFRLARRRASGH
jgi:nucleoside-diphosphate-sugar epimerase